MNPSGYTSKCSQSALITSSSTCTFALSVVLPLAGYAGQFITNSPFKAPCVLSQSFYLSLYIRLAELHITTISVGLSDGLVDMGPYFFPLFAHPSQFHVVHSWCWCFFCTPTELLCYYRANVAFALFSLLYYCLSLHGKYPRLKKSEPPTRRRKFVTPAGILLGPALCQLATQHTPLGKSIPLPPYSVTID